MRDERAADTMDTVCFRCTNDRLKRTLSNRLSYEEGPVWPYSIRAMGPDFEAIF